MTGDGRAVSRRPVFSGLKADIVKAVSAFFMPVRRRQGMFFHGLYPQPPSVCRFSFGWLRSGERFSAGSTDGYFAPVMRVMQASLCGAGVFLPSGSFPKEGRWSSWMGNGCGIRVFSCRYRPVAAIVFSGGVDVVFRRRDRCCFHGSIGKKTAFLAKNGQLQGTLLLKWALLFGQDVPAFLFGHVRQDMKKLFAALLVSGLLSGAAMAQTQIRLYGIADTGIIKESGSDARMGSFTMSRIGLDGTEDLGGGNKVTFELLQRFKLNDGTLTGNYSWDQNLRKSLGDDSKTEWTGMADVGLKGNWGHVRLGRVPDMSAHTFTLVDPFDQNGIVTSFSVYNFLHSMYLSNSIRYDSPSFSGASFGVTYTLGSDGHGNTALDEFVKAYGNDGYALNLFYDNGPLVLLANFERVADSNDSFYWNVGGTYQLDAWKFFLGYEQSTFKSLGDFYPVRGNQKEWLAGLQYRSGVHLWSASYNRGELDNSAHDGHINKYALGYAYDLSKRTQLYANVVYMDSSNEYIGSVYNSNGQARDSMNGVEFGVMHKF